VTLPPSLRAGKQPLHARQRQRAIIAAGLNSLRHTVQAMTSATPKMASGSRG
jgi:hypothetical protein